MASPRKSPATATQAKARRTKVLRIAIFASIAALTIGAIGFLYAWNTVALPPESPLEQSTILTDAKGERLATISATEKRVNVRLDEISPLIPKAVVSIEDRNFYEHGGVSFLGIGRAMVTNLRQGQVAEGGSTITQQYVKNTYVGNEQSLKRKVKEAIIATKLERRLSKDQILERYLNTIYYGRGAYGIQQATRQYFGKDAKDVSLAEASYLAGVVQSPENLDGSTNNDGATSRRNAVLDAMVLNGAVTAEEAEAVRPNAVSSYVVARQDQEPTVVGDEKGTEFFVQYVKGILIQRYGRPAVETGGLQVKTSLDLAMQTQAYDAVYGFLKPEEPVGALVSLDENGGIKAMVGGRDWETSQVNLALGTEGGGSGRQAGSTFKPFALAAAVEKDVCWRTPYAGPATLTLPKASGGVDWTVRNFDGEDFPTTSLEDATIHSVNTVYAQLALEVGPQAIIDSAKELGIESPLAPNPALVLGTDSVSPLEMANAYLTFSQGGERVTPMPVLEVKNAKGQTLETVEVEKVRVMSAEDAAVVNYLLSGVVERGTGKAAAIGKPVAGKTGTSENSGDAWFVGYTPHVATAIWMGYPEGSARPMNNVRGIKVTGGSYPARMFSSYMRAATAEYEADEFDKAPDCDPPAPATTTTSSTSSTTSTTEVSASSTTSTTTGGQNSTTTTARNRNTTTTSSTTTSTTTPARAATATTSTSTSTTTTEAP